MHAFEVARDRFRLDQMIDYALRLDHATAKRLGWVLEQTGFGRSDLTVLQQVKVTGYTKLDASGPREGPYNRAWMIQENLSGKACA